MEAADNCFKDRVSLISNTRPSQASEQDKQLGSACSQAAGLPALGYPYPQLTPTLAGSQSWVSANVSISKGRQLSSHMGEEGCHISKVLWFRRIERKGRNNYNEARPW